MDRHAEFTRLAGAMAKRVSASYLILKQVQDDAIKEVICSEGIITIFLT